MVDPPLRAPALCVGPRSSRSARGSSRASAECSVLSAECFSLGAQSHSLIFLSTQHSALSTQHFLAAGVAGPIFGLASQAEDGRTLWASPGGPEASAG